MKATRRKSIADAIGGYGDRWLGVLVVLALAIQTSPDRVIEYSVGVAAGILLALLWRPEPTLDDVHPYYVRAWIRGAHRAHDFSGSAIEYCTEPECEEGTILLDTLERDRIPPVLKEKR